MISLYSGTPGSGKSANATKLMILRLTMTKKPVLCNYPLDLDYIALTRIGRFQNLVNKLFKKKIFKNLKSKKLAPFELFDTYKVTPKYFIDYAKKNLKRNKENQALIVIDECARIFNPRMDRKDRMDWINFFQVHRHLGYSIVLIAQHSRLLDRQITYLIEYNCIHRNIKRYKMFGRILSLLCGGNLFISLKKWFSINEIESRELIFLTNRIKNAYCTFYDFDTEEDEDDDDENNKKSKLLLVDNDIDS